MRSLYPLRTRDLLWTVLFAASLYLLWLIRHTVLLIYLALIFAVVLVPAVRKVERIRIGSWSPGHGAAVALLLIAFVASITVLGFTFVPPILADTQQLAYDLPAQLQKTWARLGELPFIARLLRDGFPPAGILQGMSGHVLAAAKALAGATTDLALIIVMAAYFIVDGVTAFHWTMKLVPRDQRPQLGSALHEAAGRAQRWLIGQLLLMLILGCATAVVFGLLKIRYFYALALFAGISNFIPFIGPIASLTLGVVVAAIDSWMKVLGVVIFYAVYQQIESAYLSPRIMKAQVGLPGIAVIVALAIGSALAGLAGAMAAVPTAALVAALADEYTTKKAASSEISRQAP
jgi:predicted PurR-regulated permease PerM